MLAQFLTNLTILADREREGSTAHRRCLPSAVAPGCFSRFAACTSSSPAARFEPSMRLQTPYSLELRERVDCAPERVLALRFASGRSGHCVPVASLSRSSSQPLGHLSETIKLYASDRGQTNAPMASFR
jgi:hypothetical protein